MTITPQDIIANVKSVQRKIENAAKRAGRDPSQICLVAVTKTHQIDMITAARQAGVTDIGESYVGELIEKLEAATFQARWHYVGHLQKNKVNKLLRWCPNPVILIHSVDSLELAKKINSTAQAKRAIIPVLIQVNIAGQETKFGVEEQEAEDLIKAVLSLPSLRLEGLMTIPPYQKDPEKNRHFFARLRKMRDDLQKKFSHPLPHLSMGMSDDYQIAIEEGSTIVRVGTAIFGTRT